MAEPKATEKTEHAKIKQAGRPRQAAADRQAGKFETKLALKRRSVPHESRVILEKARARTPQMKSWQMHGLKGRERAST